MTNEVERIFDSQNCMLALIVRNNFAQPGITFFTESDLSQQLAYMRHPAGKQIDAHIHKPVPRKVEYTQETLFIKKGIIRVDFYNDDQAYLTSKVLSAGDVILLIRGGHGFEVIEDLEMLEVKQGPYAGDQDKVRFNSKSHRSTEEDKSP
jgi:mannose-6-phosphate isomerase-like protein (cupin superfamily)